jgi:hypothetical protein
MLSVLQSVARRLNAMSRSEQVFEILVNLSIFSSPPEMEGIGNSNYFLALLTLDSLPGPRPIPWHELGII